MCKYRGHCQAKKKVRHAAPRPNCVDMIATVSFISKCCQNQARKVSEMIKGLKK